MNNQDMQAGSEKLRESLSALMDGECDELSLQRLLKQAGDAERATWSRYQMVSSLLKHQEIEPLPGLSLADRVSAAIADQPVAQPVAAGRLGNLGRFAVAASVALAVIAGVQWQQNQRSGAAGTQLATVAQPVSVQPAPALASPAAVNPVVVNPALVGGQPATVMASQALPAAESARLDRYMKYHLEKAAMDNSRGMMPLARSAVYEDKR